MTENDIRGDAAALIEFLRKSAETSGAESDAHAVAGFALVGKLLGETLVNIKRIADSATAHAREL